MTDKLREAAQQALDDDLLTGQALHLIGALMSRGFLPNTLSSAERTTLWDVVKRQLKCVNKEGARAALAQQDAQNAADEVWRKLFWQAALKLKCLPSSYPDANGHVLRAIDRLMGSENAQQDAQAVPVGAIERVRKALAGRKFRETTDLEDLLRMAANVIAEDGSVIGHMKAKISAPTPPAQRVMLTDDEIEDLARGKSGHSDFARDIIEAYERKNGLRI